MQLINYLALVTFGVIGVCAQQLIIDTPTSVVECQPTRIIWSGGQAPYFVTILPGGQPSAQPLEDLGEQTGTTVTWLVDIASGTSITFEVKDSTGEAAFSSIVTIQSGPDDSCVGKNTAPA